MTTVYARDCTNISVSYADDGSATGTFDHPQRFALKEQIDLQSDYFFPGTFYIGYVAYVTKDQTKATYTMHLSDPLSLGLTGAAYVKFVGALPSDFPKNGTQEEIRAWCEENDRTLAYRHDGFYYFVGNGTDISIPAYTDQRKSDVITDPVSRAGFYNRVVVRGDAEKEIPAPVETVPTITVDGLSITETFQGDRMLARHTIAETLEETETWEWDDNTNICTRYRKVALVPSARAPDSQDRTTTTITVPQYSPDIAVYNIHKEIIGEEWGQRITGPQSTVWQLYTTLKEETEIIRNRDGSGQYIVIREEAARNKYNATYAFEDENGNTQTVTSPLFDYFKLLPASAEDTRYRRKFGRPYSFTRNFEGKLVSGMIVGGAVSDSVVVFQSVGSSAGFDEPEQPEMAEATILLRADNVEYVAEGDMSAGVWERSVSLPYEEPPDSIETDDDLYNWVYRRARNYATRMLSKGSALLEQRDIQINFYAFVDIGDRFDDYKISSITHSINTNSYTTSLTGYKTSAADAPPRTKETAGSAIINRAAAMDRNQDNIRTGVVEKPVSRTRALVNINNKRYKVDNANGGYLNAGDSTPVYRPTGATSGEVV